MSKDLHDMSKEELISVVQDYQEMVSDIEEIINEVRNKPQHLLEIRDVIDKYLMGENRGQEIG